MPRHTNDCLGHADWHWDSGERSDDVDGFRRGFRRPALSDYAGTPVLAASGCGSDAPDSDGCKRRWMMNGPVGDTTIGESGTMYDPDNAWQATPEVKITAV